MIEQLELLGSVARARRTDPVSSHLAAERVETIGKAQAQRIEALSAVARHPGRTSAELSELTTVDRYVLARRLPELRAESRVRNGESLGYCSVTGRQALTWWIAA